MIKDLTFDLLQEKNTLRCESSKGFSHSLNSWQIDQWTNAIAGETGEACNIAKKLSRIENNIRGNKVNDKDPFILKEKLGAELADIVIYCSLTAEKLGFNLGELVRTTFNLKSDEIGSDIKL